MAGSLSGSGMRIANNLGADMTTWFKVFPLFCFLLVGYGCVATGSLEITEAGRTAGIEAGKSTQAEVSALLGFPAIVTYGEKGQETWNYYYVTEYPTTTDFIPVADIGGRFSAEHQGTDAYF